MTRQCPHCSDTGVVVTNTLELGDPIIRADCECPAGRAFTAPFIGPQPGSSHQLGEQSLDKHHDAMTADGKRQCWICHAYHEVDAECPAKFSGGWVHPDMATFKLKPPAWMEGEME